MDPSTLKILQGAAGAAGDSVIGVEDVFKTYLYKGNNTARSINTGVDMTKGGMVWIKGRGAQSHALFDSERGATKWLTSQAAEAASTDSDSLTSFNNNGFSLGTGYTSADVNGNNSNQTYASWSFRKQKKFFTICTWTGNGTQNHEISHDLGSVPGAIFIKKIAAPSGGSLSDSDWFVYHRSMDSSNPQQYGILLNGNNWSIGHTRFSVQGDLNYYAPTSAHFRLGNGSRTNESGATFVAYLFAHEEAEFGPNSDQKIISCGGYSGTGSSGNTVTLPFEPGLILIKDTTKGGGTAWLMFDSMRGIVNGGNDATLRGSTNTADGTATDFLELTSTGFKITIGEADDINANGESYIYIAIAAETGKTMKAIETASDVFAMDTGAGSSTIPNFDSDFPADFVFLRDPAISHDYYAGTRKMGGKVFYTMNGTNTESGPASGWDWDSNEGFSAGNESSSIQAWMWKRHAGFDALVYDSTGNSPLVLNHNLGVVPEMIWTKNRDSAYGWGIYHKGLNGGTNPEQYRVKLESDDTEGADEYIWNETAPTASQVTLGNGSRSNQNGTDSYLMLLFASVSGVSSVGFYTGNGNALGSSPKEITTGFQPRFIIIKRLDADGNWRVFDTLRGINISSLGGANDSQLNLNDNSAADTNYNWVDVTSTSFKVTNFPSIGASGSKYIYYAHA